MAESHFWYGMVDKYATTVTDLNLPTLERLEAAHSLRIEADAILDDLAIRARKEGATWEAIGAAAWITKQAAQQRWG